jgi:hypothetical protein
MTWREKLFMRIKDRLWKEIYEIITRDRDGEEISSSDLSLYVQNIGK